MIITEAFEKIAAVLESAKAPLSGAAVVGQVEDLTDLGELRFANRIPADTGHFCCAIEHYSYDEK